MPTLPPNFLDELRARTPIQPLIGRTVRLTRSGREQKGCCPFHGEKTPSFYVYDDHYHCFGCGEHGDVITWVMKSDGASFMEAVESLSREAGLDVPRPDRQAAEAEQKRAGIAEVLEAAAAVYQRWLFAAEGRPALDYLRNRGLSDDTIRKFNLGWSGEGRGALAAALRGQNITQDQLIDAGLMKRGESGSPVDMFFSRVMFPITDRRGAKISFSGRILGEGQPKYVNGPETAVFSKRRSLYGLSFARDPVRKGAPLILVEGQMDVIALAQAGFPGAVAPLGTALTEEQLAEIWRLTPEPIFCFDADPAGRRAALKTVDFALTALAPDRGLKFLRLPEKDDPDSLIRREGPAAFAARLAAAQPLSAALYDMLAEGAARSTPEGNASFKNRLVEVSSRIPDKALAGEYRAMLLGRFFDERRGSSRQNNLRKPGWPQRKFDASLRIPIDADRTNQLRLFVIAALIVHFPLIFRDIEESAMLLGFPDICSKIFDVIHSFIDSGRPLENEEFFRYSEGAGLASEARQIFAVGLANYPSMRSLSEAEAVDAYWHFHGLTKEVRVSLTRQRDTELAFFRAHQEDDAAKQRVTKLSELVNRSDAGEQGSDS